MVVPPDRAIADTPRVLVSILNYKSVQNTIETVRSFQLQNYSNYHLQLVDNASPDDCVMQIAERLPGLDIRVLPSNLGYTGGNNYALRQGLREGYDYVIISNEDIEISPSAIQHLVETAQMNQHAGVVGGIEVDYFTGQKRAIGGRGYTFWTSRGRWLMRSENDGAQCARVDYVQGALVLFTRRSLEAGVFLDENLFIYHDECDLGFQLRSKGLAAYVDKRVIIRHKNGPAQFGVRGGYLIQRNRLYLVKKHGKWYHKFFYNIYAPLIELPVKLLVRSMQGHTRFAVSCLIGHWDALRNNMGIGRLDSIGRKR